MPVRDLLDALDDEQKNAVTLETNGVAAAGAGSGKTRVLASRYAWLVMERDYKPEEILTLTFTNKAVSEMYSRIYRYLLEQADESAGGQRAAAALKNFHKARIGTIDSFSAGIARTAAARYGISPDFKSDETALRDLAREAALRFVLDNRENPSIRTLLADHKIKDLAEDIFVQFVLKHSPISSPPALSEKLAVQKELLEKVWREKTRELRDLTSLMIDALRELAERKMSIGFTRSLAGVLLEGSPPPAPDTEELFETDDSAALSRKLRIKKYFDYYSALAAVDIPGNYGAAYAQLAEHFKRFKGKDRDGLYFELESIANNALNFGLCTGIFDLAGRFRDEFNSRKRETGLLSFSDIAHLALDALRDHPDIRKSYKDSLRMIMIDEFQDNNALQRDLIYLLAENPARLEKGMAAPGELEGNRMFFVGDEKQSIYRFRGADVAVFRSLGKDLAKHAGGGEIGLIHNYRSRPSLIEAFNRIFGGSDEGGAPADGVFLPPGSHDYEAVYSRIRPPEETKGEDPSGRLASFCFVNGGALPEDDSGGIRSQDLEAVFIARRIRDMVGAGEKVLKRTPQGTGWAECTWGDFAVIERAYTHQGTLEKYFREFGVPYSTDRPSGLFNDAPILDLRAYLRLLVYPEDKIAYAALIRSPFTRLSDLTLAVCMLKKTEPFAEENEALIPGEDLELYRRARERYGALREASRVLSVTELLVKLWFDEGYRYETLWTESAQVYENLFDLFFSLAADADARGKSLAEFIEYLDDVMNREEKPDAKDIPGEGVNGVRIITIHKSKGLEFPVVFIYDCAHSGNTGSSRDLVNYHEKYGPILGIPRAAELPVGGNYFLGIFREEEKAKDIAELRRLLYVAMTRAESRLFLTFTLPPRTIREKGNLDDESGEFDEDAIRRRLIQLDGKFGDTRDTFLKLLSGVLPGCASSLCAFEAIPVLTRAEISALAMPAGPVSRTKPAPEKTPGQREAALAAAPFYDKAALVPAGRAGPPYLEASKLRCIPRSPIKQPGNAEGKIGNSAFDSVAEKAGLSAADFGSLVHAVVEGRLNLQPCVVPKKIKSRVDDERSLKKLMGEAEVLADKFLVSELGKRWEAGRQAGDRQSEFPIITSALAEGKPVAITGQIDLLLTEEDEVVVVDFKTDRIENPEDHYGQLAAYYRAAGDIFGKPISVWLFYLRSGRAVNVTENIRSLSLEDIAAYSISMSSAEM